jgi:hypothetical protein
MTKRAAARDRTTDDRLDDIEAMLAELVRKRRADKRAGAKRAGTIAHRAAAGITHRPTELQRAFVRSRNRSL